MKMGIPEKNSWNGGKGGMVRHRKDGPATGRKKSNKTSGGKGRITGKR